MKRVIYYFADSKDDIEKRLETLKRLPTIPERLMITASSSSSSSDEIINSSLNSTTSSKSTQESNSVSLYFSCSNCIIYDILYK